MPLNHYQQEVGPSLADASPGKMPDVALLEGRYCSVEHLTLADRKSTPSKIGRAHV